MRRTGIVRDERFLDHDTGPGHPERPARLEAIYAALDESPAADKLVPIPATPVDLQWVETVHRRDYIERLRYACQAGQRYIDVPDSTIGPASYEIALLAVGGCLNAVDAVMKGDVDNAFCAIRPPGHHCEHDRSMGFCLFNNIAIAAEYLRRHHKLSRVLILDWDVHHGNGTQHTFESRDDVFFCSIHEHPRFLYPGTGFEHETGHGAGLGKTLNLPLLPRSGDDDVKRVYSTMFEPAARAFKPEFILVSAGFDAHCRDPLATLAFSDEAFDWLALRTLALAGELCGGRLVCFLEGGYDLQALSTCVRRHVERLMCGNGADAGPADAAASEMRKAARHADGDTIFWW